MFQEQKSTRTKLHEQSQLSRGEKSIYKFHEEKKNRHHNKFHDHKVSKQKVPRIQKSARDKFHEQNKFHDEEESHVQVSRGEAVHIVQDSR